MAAPFFSTISLGLKWKPKNGKTSEPAVYDRDRNLITFGPVGSGKGVSLEIVNLLRLGSPEYGGPLSIINIDPKAQNVAVTRRWRETVSEIVLLNPLDVLGLGSAGFNPLAALDPASPRFFEECSSIAEALIKIEGKDPFFDQSARSLMLALIIWEVKLANAAGRLPSLENTRSMLADLPATAKDMMASGDFQLMSLAARFVQENRTIEGIKTTVDTQTRWLLSAPMRADLAKNGIDFAVLKQKPVTVYVILPPEFLDTFSVWLRLVVACALNALYRQGGAGLRTLFMLSEFAQLGKMDQVTACLAQGRGYKITLWPVLQDINQLRAIYGKDQANTFLGMSGATFSFCPNDPETAEWMSLRSGEEGIPGLSSGDDQHGGARDNWSEKNRRALPRDALYNIPEFHGLVWFAGQTAAVPVYAPPYWKCPDLQGRYDPDPYHPGSAAGARSRGLAGKLATAALVAGLVVAGAWLFGM
jgi:type IV secretion system protein VirD4